MIGVIQHYDEKTREGCIIGRDRKRYNFSRADYRNNNEPQKGITVDFQIDGVSAKEIIAIRTVKMSISD